MREDGEDGTAGEGRDWIWVRWRCPSSLLGPAAGGRASLAGEWLTGQSVNWGVLGAGEVPDDCGQTPRYRRLLELRSGPRVTPVHRTCESLVETTRELETNDNEGGGVLCFEC